MTIADLANALGVTRKTIYNWMAHGSIPQSALEKMATLFDCSIDCVHHGHTHKEEVSTVSIDSWTLILGVASIILGIITAIIQR